MSKQAKFLEMTLGETGACAIRKAADRYPGLAGVLVPRAILSWLQAEAMLDDQSQRSRYVPGVDGAKFALVKSEDGWNGWVSSVGQTYDFKGQSLFHAAGALAIAMGVELGDLPASSDVQLERLGKSLDLLAKAQVVQRELAKKDAHKIPAPKIPEGQCGQTYPGHPHVICKLPRGHKKEHQYEAAKEFDKGQESAGGAAAPRAPKAPQMGQAGATPGGAGQAGTAAGSGMKAPKGPKKPPSLRIMKSESEKACGVCGKPQFKNQVFVGCNCFQGLAKSVKVTALSDQLHLDFNGPGWDKDAILALRDTFIS